MFRAPLCPSSGAQEYYTVVAACGISCCCFQVVGLVWSWGLCVRFAGCCSILQTGHTICNLFNLVGILFPHINCHLYSYCVQIRRKLYCTKLDDKGAFGFVLCMRSNALWQCCDRQTSRHAGNYTEQHVSWQGLPAQLCPTLPMQPLRYPLYSYHKHTVLGMSGRTNFYLLSHQCLIALLMTLASKNCATKNYCIMTCDIV